MLSAEPVCSCAHFFVQLAHETAGAARTRSSLRPLFERGREIHQRPGRIAPREAYSIYLLAVAFRSNQRDGRKVVSITPRIARKQRQVFSRGVRANEEIRQYAAANTA